MLLFPKSDFFASKGFSIRAYNTSPVQWWGRCALTLMGWNRKEGGKVGVDEEKRLEGLGRRWQRYKEHEWTPVIFFCGSFISPRGCKQTYTWGNCVCVYLGDGAPESQNTHRADSINSVTSVCSFCLCAGVNIDVFVCIWASALIILLQDPDERSFIQILVGASAWGSQWWLPPELSVLLLLRR